MTKKILLLKAGRASCFVVAAVCVPLQPGGFTFDRKWNKFTKVKWIWLCIKSQKVMQGIQRPLRVHEVLEVKNIRGFTSPNRDNPNPLAYPAKTVLLPGSRLMVPLAFWVQKNGYPERYLAPEPKKHNQNLLSKKAGKPIRRQMMGLLRPPYNTAIRKI